MVSRTDYDPSQVAPPPVASAMPVTGAFRRISWGAIFAGVVISLITQLLLATLGLGIGLSTIDPTAAAGTPQASQLTLGASIWWAISGILAALAGAWVAARLAGMPIPTAGVLHGLVTWAVATLVVLYLLTTAASNLVGGAFSVLGNAVSGLGQAAGAAASTVAGAEGGPLQQVEQQARDLLAANSDDPQAATEALTSALARLLTAGENASAADRQTVVDLLAQQTGMSPQEAQRRLQDWENAYRQTAAQAKQTALQAAETTTNAVSTAAISAFIALLLGAIAGAIGGRLGTPRDEPMIATTRY